MIEENNFTLEWAGKQLSVQTGVMAQQTNGSCLVRHGETVVLVTAVMSDTQKEDINFFPLLTDYEEKLYAAGKIKGSRFVKRETAPSDEAKLSARLVDRSIRPLFSKDMRYEVQVVITVLSVDGENDPDVPALIGASIALHTSNIPWAGPVAGIRVSKLNGQWIFNPNYEQREAADFEVLVAGDGENTIMLEAGAGEADEDSVFEAISKGQEQIKPVIEVINKIRDKIGKEKISLEKNLTEEEMSEKKKIEEATDIIRELVDSKVESYLLSGGKKTKTLRKEGVKSIKNEIDEYLNLQQFDEEIIKKAMCKFNDMIEAKISDVILHRKQRVDGRGLDEIRSLYIKNDVLPRTHGSAIFQRGETQILSVVTLGGPGEEQLLDGMEESGKKRYMHHYNFPGYSVGEVKPIRGPSRRDIGHGALAEKAILPIIPSKDIFPYTIRVVSEVLGSNGSSSMASACGSSLALMDAGVPIKKHVAGIAMGLVSDKDGNYRILTDLQDLEDSEGGMDFKVTGTLDGITAIQMDTKTHGLTPQIVKETLFKAKEARGKLIDEMNKILPEHADLSEYAPKVERFKIDLLKIKDVIGPGGKVINEIIEKTKVSIEIENDGTVYVWAIDRKALEKAVNWIKNIVKDIEVGDIFENKITRIVEFGAFMEIVPGKEGLIHISELAHKRVDKVSDVVNVGDVVKAKVIEIDNFGRINLSIRAVKPAPYSQRDSRAKGKEHNRYDRRNKKPYYKK